MHTTTRLLTSLGYVPFCVFFFFFNDTATTEIYTLSLHDALPIAPPLPAGRCHTPARKRHPGRVHWVGEGAWPTGSGPRAHRSAGRSLAACPYANPVRPSRRREDTFAAPPAESFRTPT